MSTTVDRDIAFDAPVDHFYVNGAWRSPSTSDTTDVIDSCTEELMFRVATVQDADVDAALTAARRAFDEGPWPRMSHQERAEYLRALADGLEAAVGVLDRLWVKQSGVTLSMAHHASPVYAGMFRDYADLVESFPFEERRDPTAGGEFGLLRREAVGVVAAIVPWNAPMVLLGHKIAPALLAGCPVVLKATSEAPGEAYVVAQIADEIGLPPGVLNVLTADREVSERLVADPRVDKVSFTGSTAAGRRIAAVCAERIGRTTLELGGKSAAVVLDDYDLESAARAIADQSIGLTGQTCSALTRVIVSRDRHDELVDALAERLAGFRVGDPFDSETQMGPLASERQLARVQEYVERGVAEGARLVTGGKRPKHLERGWFIEPTLFAEVKNSSSIAQEEIFGPVLTVIPSDSEDGSIALANDTIYGLNNSVFTDDVDRAVAIARRLRSGTVGHNAFRTDFGIAFGGFKQSGVGREGGAEGLSAYLETKTIILEGVPAASNRER